MSDEQFKELMKKLDNIEREIKAGQWQHLFKPAPYPFQPTYYPGYGPNFVPSFPTPTFTD